ncbi:MAG: carbon-nitrogen family hydrolase [Verrucomicrobiales bacterium]|nr:carbon-nitrogen family hydrolase [Verrucomicrobiales bacterium]
MEVIGLQFDIEWENPEANYRKIEDYLAGISARSDALIILPEMFATGFSMNLDATLEAGDLTRSEEFLQKLAKEKGCAVMGGFATPSKRADRGQNELAVFSPSGEKICRYQKNRAFRYTREADHYLPGREMVVFDWAGWKIAPLICYDLRFPELFRRATAMGAELITVIASWPAVRADHWVTLLRARAIENQAYVVGVNRTGEDPNLDYPGRSIIIDPWGEILADGGGDDGLIRAEIDLETVRGWRDDFPALEDMEA